jgi:acetyltransferase-like isoleucine patch superfamily enzyme
MNKLYKKSIRFLVIVPVNLVRKTFYFAHNYTVMKVNQVKFKTFPLIKGRLVIVNRGELTIGAGVKFNSSLYSNFVGLNKPCTIEVAPGARLKIDDHSGFSGVSIYCANEITIGKFLFCGGNVSIWDTDFHPIDPMQRRAGSAGTNTSPIEIGDDVFIGAHSLILKGVSIGNNSVIGAGSVVTKNIPANEIWAGNPAKKISDLKKN